MTAHQRSLLVLATLSVALCSLALAISAPSARAKPKVLGAASPAPASCPENCLVEARVTGFQTSIEGAKKPFVVPAHGRLIAWSVKLGRPTQADKRFFNREFGAPRARLSVLKPIRDKRGKRKYRLVRQSPSVKLGPFLGEVATFALPRALPVRKGQVVALTIPTWAPSFAAGMSGASRWTASRTSKRKCFVSRGLANVKAGKAHQRRGSELPYRCSYKGSRLLYSARFVRDSAKRG